MRFLPWLLVIGLCGFGYYEQLNARKASELNKGLEEELAITKAKLDSATIENVTGKHQLERNLKEIADKDSTKRELADLQSTLQFVVQGHVGEDQVDRLIGLDDRLGLRKARGGDCVMSCVEQD